MYTHDVCIHTMYVCSRSTHTAGLFGILVFFGVLRYYYFTTTLLLLYYYFTTNLLLLYYYFTTGHTKYAPGDTHQSQHRGGIGQRG